MNGPLYEAHVAVTADTNPLLGGLERLAGPLVARLGVMGSAAGAAFSAGLTAGITAGVAALTGGGVLAALSVKLASDAEEAASKFGFVFGAAAEATGKSLDVFAQAAGRSRFELR